MGAQCPFGVAHTPEAEVLTVEVPVYRHRKRARRARAAVPRTPPSLSGSASSASSAASSTASSSNSSHSSYTSNPVRACPPVTLRHSSPAELQPSEGLLASTVAVTTHASGRGLDAFHSIVLLDPPHEAESYVQRAYPTCHTSVVGLGDLVPSLLELHKQEGAQYAVLGDSLSPCCGRVLAWLSARPAHRSSPLLHDPLTGTIWVVLRRLARQVKAMHGSVPDMSHPLFSSFAHVMRTPPVPVEVG